MRSLPVVAIALLVGSAAVAGAEAMDTITFNFPDETYPSRYLPPITVDGALLSETLPAMPQAFAPPFPGAGTPGFWYNTDGQPFSSQPWGAPGESFNFYPGGVSYAITYLIYYPPAYSYFTLANGGSLYSGPATAPTLDPGVYNAFYDVDFMYYGEFQLPGTITIAPVSSGTSAVPEPGSLSLVAGGVLATLGMWRGRRRVA